MLKERGRGSNLIGWQVKNFVFPFNFFAYAFLNILVHASG